MRKQTLAVVSFFIAFAIIFLLNALARTKGIKLPFVGLVSPLVASLIIVPLLLVPLTALNQYILAWRKARGRDIEEEEKHEFGESDIISLKPRESHEEPSSYQRYK